MFWDWNPAELSVENPERIHSATDERKWRVPQPNIRQSLVSPVEEVEEKGKEEESWSSGEQNPQNQGLGTHGSSLR